MSSYPIGFKDYKDEVIQLRKSISALKRGKPTDWDLEVLGCSIDEFWHLNQHLVANNFNVKEREKFVKRLEALGCDLFDAYHIKSTLDLARHKLDEFPDDTYLQAVEMVLGNLLMLLSIFQIGLATAGPTSKRHGLEEN